jgi:UTP--glucose-1-phosphate uridylyltransferase
MGRAVALTVRKAIFPVAGLGTRFLPATKSIPKEILTLVDRPLIDYAVEEARAASIEDFIFLTSRGKSALNYYFDDAPELEAAGKWDALEAPRDNAQRVNRLRTPEQAPRTVARRGLRRTPY